MADILIKNGIIITMDRERRILENSAIAIESDRIVAIGPTDEVEKQFPSKKTLDAYHMAILPGLIDGHNHAGHAMVKTMGDGNGEHWYDTVRLIYTEGATVNFWKADAQLAALDRLKNGVTTCLSYFGGGASISRVDNPVYAIEHLKSVQEVGVREILAVGPCPPPFPTKFSEWNNGNCTDCMVSFDKQLEVTENIIKECHKTFSDRLHVCVTFPVFGPQDEFQLDNLKKWSTAVKNLYKKFDVLFTQDGHKKGTILFQHEKLGLSGPDAIFSHSVDLSTREIEICVATGSIIVHNPSSVSSIRGRCPVPELLDAGVTVMLGSDSAAPDRGSDMFRHMFNAMHYHRTYFHDEHVLPPGKILEMVTIDSAKGLGLDKEIGSLEVGKKADILLLDLRKPHLYPLNMIPSRLTYYAHGSDVDTVLVGGEILMLNRKVTCVDEETILDNAQKELEAVIERTGTQRMLNLSDNYWGHTRY